MPLSIIPLSAAVALIALSIYKFLIYPTFISPLAKIPNAHWSAPISPLWILFHRQRQNDTPTVHDAHTRLGPLVRLAPNEISVNCVDGGIRTIYGGGFEKGDWYSNAFCNYDVAPMFAMEHNAPHSKRKRMLSNIYAKSTLHASEALRLQTSALIHDHLRPRLRAAADADEDVEMYDLFSAVMMDFVTGYIFGHRNGTRFTREDVSQGVALFHDFKARQPFTFWIQELPRFTAFLQRCGLLSLVVPPWVHDANAEIEAWVLTLCDAAAATLQSHARDPASVRPEDYPTVYAQLHSSLQKDRSKPAEDSPHHHHDHHHDHRLTLASELLDHTLAGFDTSGTTLTWLAHHLSLPPNSHWQTRLRHELFTLPTPFSPRALDALPLLDALVRETLRLHAAIPGNQPRMTPSGKTVFLGPHPAVPIPPHVRVQSQAYSLHRDPSIFPSPELWDPARWLHAPPASLAAMHRHFWAFSSGGRMCVGAHLALSDMKAAAWGVWGAFRTEVVCDVGMRPNGGYMAEPVGVGPGGRGRGCEGRFDPEVHGVRGEGRRFLRVRVRGV
jgi:unspecific monooxygenase